MNRLENTYASTVGSRQTYQSVTEKIFCKIFIALLPQ